MASKIRVGSWLYRINPEDPKSLQRASLGSSSWSHVCGFNGYDILDLLQSGDELYIVTERYDYIRHNTGICERV